MMVCWAMMSRCLMYVRCVETPIRCAVAQGTEFIFAIKLHNVTKCKILKFEKAQKLKIPAGQTIHALHVDPAGPPAILP